MGDRCGREDPLNANVASGGHATKDLATGQIEGLFLGHLDVLNSAGGIHGGTGSLGWGRGSGRGSGRGGVLGGLEERHDCNCWFGLWWGSGSSGGLLFCLLSCCVRNKKKR